MFVNLWVVFALAVLLEDWLRRSTLPHQRFREAIVAVVLLFCLIEQTNTTWRTGLARAQELARLDQVPRPPSECEAFLVAPPQPLEYVAAIDAQYDAMWIAMKTGLPTLNGMSGTSPPHWRLTYWPNTDPIAEAHAWIKGNGITQRVCIYDRDKRSWAPFGQIGVR